MARVEGRVKNLAMWRGWSGTQGHALPGPSSPRQNPPLLEILPPEQPVGGQGRGGDVKTGGGSTWWRFQPQTQVSLHCTLPLWPHLQVAGSSLRRLLGGMREVTGSVLRTRHIVVALPADPASNYAEGRVGWFSFLSPTLPACSILSRLIRSCCYLKSPSEHRSGHCRGGGDKTHTHTHTLSLSLSLSFLLLCASCWVGEGANPRKAQCSGESGRDAAAAAAEGPGGRGRKKQDIRGALGPRGWSSGPAQPVPAVSLAPAPWSLLIQPRGTDVEVEPGETCPALTRVQNTQSSPILCMPTVCQSFAHGKNDQNCFPRPQAPAAGQETWLSVFLPHMCLV